MKILYEQKGFPILQNRVYDSAVEAKNCPKGDLRIIEDHKTGLVYNHAFDSTRMLYDANYNNEQSFSPYFRNHLEEVVKIIKSTLGTESLIEVGCGKAYFLELLIDYGFDISGFDSTYEGNNPLVIKKNFEPGIISVPAKGLVLRHVLEHIPNPYEFLEQLCEANGGGLIYIEVPCLDWIIRKKAWFDIFYEHVNYFRSIDFERMFGLIIDKGSFFGGQYQYIVADLASLKKPTFDHLNEVSFPENFLSKINLAEECRPLCAWGAASKGVIFSLLAMRQRMKLDYIIDVNPSKQGKFLPVSGLEVISPKSAMKFLPNEASIFVMNSNYFREIKDMSENRFNYIKID